MCNCSLKVDGYKVVQSRPYFRNKPIIVILGAPGAGKTTQSARLVERFKFARMNVVELLREATEAQTKQGEYLRNLIALGEVVPNEFIIDLLLKPMYEVSHTCTGVVVDGFPQNKEQGPLFEERIARIDMILNIECPEAVLYERTVCQAEISDIPSEDDTDAAFSERMQKYNDNICAILKPFKDRVENIRGDKEPHVIFRKIEESTVNLIWDKDCALIESLKKAKPKIYTQPKKCDPPNRFY